MQNQSCTKMVFVFFITTSMVLSFRYYKITHLVITILVLSLLLDLIFKYGILPLIHRFNIELLRAPGNAAIIAMILTWHNKTLWKKWIGSWLVDLPNLSGRYKGKIKFTRNNITEEKDCVVEIYQTASIVKVNSYFSNSGKEKTASESLVEDVVYSNNFYSIYLFYLNKGSGDGQLDAHEGAQSLKFIPGNSNSISKLTGNYFTNRLQQTRGTMEVMYESAELKGGF